jgi:replicative DNA helicase
MTIEGRIPPQSVELEKAVLGAILLDKEAVPRAIEILDASAFYNPTNQKIMQAVINLFERSEPSDTLAVMEELKRMGKANPAEDPVYLTELTMGVSSAANVEFYAHVVLEKSLARAFITETSKLQTRAYDDAEDTLDLLDDAEAAIFRISERRMKKQFTPIKDALLKSLDVLEKIQASHSNITGVPSGFHSLDDKTAGFQNSDLVIVAGRPSQGKTALALSIAKNAALHSEKPVSIALFSLEMSEQQLMVRLLSASARVNAHQLRTGRLSQGDWKDISTATGQLSKAKIFIDDTASLSILELRAKARRLKAEHGIGLVIVDYLQLVQGPRNSESREREVSMISRSLKALAKELDVPVMALSQLNRAVESRAGDKRPVLSDLRESGAIEQDADVVLFVHRPESYGAIEIKDDDGTVMPAEGVAEIIIGKQRNGPTGIIRLSFKKEYAGFENLFRHPSGPVMQYELEDRHF